MKNEPISQQAAAAGLSLPMPAERLIPHRETMLLIGEMLGYREDYAMGRARIEPGNAFVDARERLETPAMLELLAQLGALHICHASKLSGKRVQIGYLAGVHGFEYYQPARLGDVVELETQSVVKIGQARVMEIEARRERTVLAGGRLTFWTLDDLPEAAPAHDGENEGPGAPADIEKQLRLDCRSEMRRHAAQCLMHVERSGASNSLRASFHFPSGFLGFRGHFPGHPVLPGVVMLDAVALAAEIIARRPLEIVRVKQAKFSRPVYPGQSISLDVELFDSGSGSQAKGILDLEGQRAAKISIQLRDAEFGSD